MNDIFVKSLYESIVKENFNYTKTCMKQRM